MGSKSTVVGLFFFCSAVLATVVLDKAFTATFLSMGVSNNALLGERFTLSTLLAVVLSFAGAGYAMVGNQKSRRFVEECVDEVGKIAFPEWSETKMNTVVVIVFSFVSAGILGVFDTLFSWLTSNNFFLY